MSRKHYVAIAAAIKARRDITRGVCELTASDVLDGLARDFAVIFKGDNLRFERGRFLVASGVE